MSSNRKQKTNCPATCSNCNQKKNCPVKCSKSQIKRWIALLSVAIKEKKNALQKCNNRKKMIILRYATIASIVQWMFWLSNEQVDRPKLPYHKNIVSWHIVITDEADILPQIRKVQARKKHRTSSDKKVLKTEEGSNIVLCPKYTGLKKKYYLCSKHMSLRNKGTTAFILD